VRRGLASSRHEAQRLVGEARVLVDGAVADKTARLVARGQALVVRDGPPRFVSRGGTKLAAALDRFSIDVSGRLCLDAGASTGGFTDCLLQRGAVRVVAVDVGHGQFDVRLRADRRVTLFERANVRALDTVWPPVDPPPSRPDPYGSAAEDGERQEVPRFTAVVADLSFISLTVVAPVLAGNLVAVGADVVALVKPQFEAGRAAADRGRGVIRDAAERRAALGRVASAFVAAGASIMGAMASPLLGPAGNVEYLLHVRAHRPEPGDGRDRVEAVLDAAVAESPDTVMTESPEPGRPGAPHGDDA
jgi:23S rRNA (cytidine1920-2'-O)/16S rRNA (cytidine1409-2'-O)-methyltransferase